MLSSWNGILYEYYKTRSDEVIYWGQEDSSYPISEYLKFLLGVPILYITDEIDEKTIKVHAQISVNLAIKYELSMVTSFCLDDKENMIKNENISEKTADSIMENYKKMDCSTENMNEIKVDFDDINDKYDIKTNNEPFTNIILFDECLQNALQKNYLFSLTIVPVKNSDLHKIDIYVRENKNTNSILDREDIGDMVNLCRQAYGALQAFRLM